MQQTNKYKLNLIEKTDPFSPDALNENTQKVENVLSAALAGEEAAREAAVGELTAADQVLSQRVTALELKKMAYGTYKGSDPYSERTIELPFTPKLVLIQNHGLGSSLSTAVAATNRPATSGNQGTVLSVTANGFKLHASNLENLLNRSGNYYSYIAFA